MKRLAIVVQRCHESVVGGSESLAWQYARLLSSAFEVEVLTSTATDYMRWDNALPEGETQREGIVVRRFKVERGRTPYWFQLHARLLRRHAERAAEPPASRIGWTPALDDEFVRAQGPWCPALEAYLRAQHERFAAIMFCTYLYPTTHFGASAVPTGKRIFVPTLHDEPTAYLGSFRDRAAGFPHIIWLTESERQVAARLWGRSDGTVIGMAVDQIRAVAREARRRPYLLYCGRIEQGKGCDRLLSAWRRLRRRTGVDAELVLTGAKSMRLPWWRRDVRFLGFVDEARKRALMAGAAAFVLPSQYESFSIVTLEAMAQGTPVIVNADCTVMDEHIRRSGAGVAFRGDEELEHAMGAALVRDLAERSRLGKAGQQYVSERYGEARVRAALVETVRGVTEAA